MQVKKKNKNIFFTNNNEQSDQIIHDDPSFEIEKSGAVNNYILDELDTIQPS